MFPFENISVSSFSPDDRKWTSGAMAEAVTAGEAAKNGGMWIGFIVDGDGLVGSIFHGVAIHIPAFVFWCSHFLFLLTYFRFSNS